MKGGKDIGFKRGVSVPPKTIRREFGESVQRQGMGYGLGGKGDRFGMRERKGGDRCGFNGVI